jgi:biotin operon repressor
MKSILDRLVRLDYLIHLKATGNPAKLGSKIGISERSVYDYLRLMRELGAEIKYSRQLASYYYLEYGHFRIGFFKKEESAFHMSANDEPNTSTLLGLEQEVSEQLA